jgi:molybdopterin/thiamine biosynthesis adenylyltransferase
MGSSMYEKLIERNLGIFAPEEQQRIRDAKVVIIGCGGIGGVVATALARSGLGHFVLYDHDAYQPSNLNRQMSCFTDTLGVNKAIATREAILRINPEADVAVCTEALRPDEIGRAIQMGDVFMPAADDWPLSIAALNAAKDLGKPAIMAYPVGALARVSTFLPNSPYAAECLVMPYKVSYDGLKAFMDNPDNRRILHYYRSEGAWTQAWFDSWCEGQQPHAQLCVTVWITGALAALEILKLVSGKWEPVVAPHYWHITPTSARIARFSLARRLLSRQVRHPWGQALLPALAKRPWLVRIFTRLIS